jgi:hypothetical protein
MNLLLMIMVFALGVALAKYVVKIGLKVMSFALHGAAVTFVVLAVLLAMGAIGPVLAGLLA